MTRRIARVTLEVDVYLEEEPGINTPDAHELPYEYLAVRDVEAVSTETFGDARPLALIGFDGFENHDPDDLIHSALCSALYSPQEEDA